MIDDSHANDRNLELAFDAALNRNLEDGDGIRTRWDGLQFTGGRSETPANPVQKLIRDDGTFPKMLVLFFTFHDVDRGGDLSDDIALNAYRLLTTQSPAPTAYRPKGPYGQCFQNVGRVVQTSGGSAVCGWAVGAVPPPHPLVKNVLAALGMIAHSVWRTPEGHLVEVTEGMHTHQFYIDSAVRSPSQYCLRFADDRAAADLIRINGSNVCKRLIPAPAVL